MSCRNSVTCLENVSVSNQEFSYSLVVRPALHQVAESTHKNIVAIRNFAILATT